MIPVQKPRITIVDAGDYCGAYVDGKFVGSVSDDSAESIWQTIAEHFGNVDWKTPNPSKNLKFEGFPDRLEEL